MRSAAVARARTPPVRELFGELEVPADLLEHLPLETAPGRNARVAPLRAAERMARGACVSERKVREPEMRERGRRLAEVRRASQALHRALVLAPLVMDPAL